MPDGVDDALFEARMAAATPAGLAHFTSGGRWKTFEYLLLIDSYLMRLYHGEFDRLIVEAPIRHGKALALNTPVATPDGWKTIGTLVVGDEVFDEKGQPCAVIAKSPVWQDRECYAVRTDDGDEIVADAEHEWMVGLDMRHRPHTKTTAHLAQRNGQAPIVGLTAPLELPERDLPVAPYTLGLWLGDGNADSATITAGEADFAWTRGAVEVDGYATSDRSTAHTFGVLGLQAALRSLNLLCNKHVPPAYMRASAQQRLELVQGLVDSDGYVAPDGQVEFCSTNITLALAVQELVCSLGHKASMIEGRATWDGRDHGTKYRVMFYMDPCARMPRKDKRTRHGIRAHRRYLTFEKVASRPTQCIQVNSRSHLFLAGRSMTPTHNSQLISHYLPVWWMGHRPEDELILASFEATFAATWGRQARDTMAEFGPKIFGLSIGEPASTNEWKLAGHNGKLKTVGAGTAPTGRGADLLIIDDPVGSSEMANSEVYRQKTWEWWQADISSRLEPGGKVVLVMARWHEDDLAGRIKENQDPEMPWTVLRIPALAEDENDPLGRVEGEALCPERFNRKALLRAKRERGNYWFNALYQQRPAPAEGLLFKRNDFRYYEVLGDPDEGDAQVYRLKDGPAENEWRTVPAIQCVKFQTADIAGSERTQADWTVVSTFAVTPSRDLLLLHSKRQKFETLKVAEFLKAENDAKGNPPMWIETFGAGKVPHKQLSEAGYPVREFKAETGSRADKIQRAMPAVAAYERHKVFHPNADKHPWAGIVEETLVGFPTAKDKDTVDTVSYAGWLLPTMMIDQEVQKSRHKTTMGNLWKRVW